ncbi:TerD family protein [Nocardiopsis chromatogenes]|uniref:TerD family protein n=1 Tax=Nocardiopsis chromatogenes TaxID=280239 RepID=UPI00034546FE|nr:TerD family protein [Nocardiopsis chromatogenes]
MEPISLQTRLIQATGRVPSRPGAPSGDGSAVARQMDAVLLTVGFACARDLLEHVSAMEPGAAFDTAADVLAAARLQVGDHVRHNVYFVDFPENVPDTLDFWAQCIADAFVGPDGEEITVEDLLPDGVPGPVSLTELPTYGRYQHTYADLLARHEALAASSEDRVTVLRLGGPLDDEAHRLYLDMAASPVPHSDDGRDLLAALAAHCADREQPEAVPVRENRALVNRAHLEHGRAPDVDTVTDVLRLACALSDGDVTLAEPTRFTSPRRRDRRALLAALDRVVAEAPAKLGDVNRYANRWKRLGERLHPHEYAEFPNARQVFAVARGDRRAPSPEGRIEAAFAAADLDEAVRLLSASPGMLVRSLDRLLRLAGPERADTVAKALAGAAPSVAGRVLLSARAHLDPRRGSGAPRVFANRGRRAWIVPDGRAPLGRDTATGAVGTLDAEIAARLPAADRVLVDPEALQVALPTAGAPGRTDGTGVLPRGSTTAVDGDRLRFFVHWRQARLTTDLDLSVLLLQKDFTYHGQLSWTELEGHGGKHSGDIVEAPEGATEMIDLDLSRVGAAYVVPQVDLYEGEGFDELAEVFFGYMTRGANRKGRPFEARTVRMKSDLSGSGRVALPLVFARGGTRKKPRWRARWTHLSLTGEPDFNRVEANSLSTGLLARGIMERPYFTVAQAVELMRGRGAKVEEYQGQRGGEGTVYIGLERPERLREHVAAFTPDRLGNLLSH